MENPKKKSFTGICTYWASSKDPIKNAGLVLCTELNEKVIVTQYQLRRSATNFLIPGEKVLIDDIMVNKHGDLVALDVLIYVDEFHKLYHNIMTSLRKKNVSPYQLHSDLQQLKCFLKDIHPLRREEFPNVVSQYDKAATIIFSQLLKKKKSAKFTSTEEQTLVLKIREIIGSDGKRKPKIRHWRGFFKSLAKRGLVSYIGKIRDHCKVMEKDPTQGDSHKDWRDLCIEIDTWLQEQEKTRG